MEDAETLGLVLDKVDLEIDRREDDRRRDDKSLREAIWLGLQRKTDEMLGYVRECELINS